MNKIELMGRIGNDLKLEGEGERQYCRFSLAVRKGKEETDWFNCTAFGKSANTLYNWCEKGSQVCIVGRMTSSKKEDKTYWSVNVDEVHIIDFKKKEEPQKQQSTDTSLFGKSSKDLGIDTDALPFY